SSGTCSCTSTSRSSRAGCAGTAPRRTSADLRAGARALDQLVDAPRCRNAQALAVARAEQQMAALDRALEERAQQRDVAPPVALDLVDAPLLPPRERLEPVGTLRLAEVLERQMAEREAEPDAVADGVEHVEGPESREIEVGVAAQDGVVEAAHVEPDHQVGL